MNQNEKAVIRKDFLDDFGYDGYDEDDVKELKAYALELERALESQPVAGQVSREDAIAEFRADELDAVMYFVDKWFDENDPRLKDNPATRASSAREIALKAIEAQQPQAPVTPDGYLFQHGETGRTTFVMPDELDSFSRDNPRWSNVGPMYKYHQAPAVEVPSRLEVMKAIESSRPGLIQMTDAVMALLTSRQGGHS